MSYDRRWYQRPPAGTPLGHSDPILSGLMGFYALGDATGKVARDATGRLDLTLTGFSAADTPWGSGPSGAGLVVTGVSRGAVAPLPAAMRLGWPMSILVGVRILGSVNNSQRIFALTPNNTNASPFGVIEVYAGSNTLASFAFVNGSTLVLSGGHTIAQGVDYVLGLRVTPTSWAAFVNGDQVASGAGTYASPDWASWANNPQVVAGGWPAVAGASACNPLYWAGWWGRGLSDGEFASVRTPDAIWRRLYGDRIKSAIVASPVASIVSATPSSVFAGSTTTVAVVGFATAWSGTPFSLVGAPAGTSIAGQTVTDGTHASVTIQAGSTPGPFSLSDGSHTFPMSVAASSFSASPSTIPANHGGNITLDLTGQGTSWTSGTTFTLPAISGLSLASKTWHSATSVTLVVTTGAGTGTGVITDSTDADSAALTVATASVSASPSSVGVPSTTAVLLTGTNTLWRSETPSSLFTPSGIAGATLTSVNAATDTSASATLTIPSGTGGTLTVADNSTGATTTIAAHAATAGSLHVAAPLLLQAATPAFGGQPTAWLAFRFVANSNAGLNLATGTAILDFAGNTPNNSVPVAYQPATRTLRFVFYAAGGSSAFSATVPVQVGVNDHFLLAWQSGSQVLYRNGVPYATGSVAGNTYAYGALQFGGDAGNAYGTSDPQATDHTVADLAIGTGSVPSPSEAAGLADGSTSPLQLAAPAAAWWPLGGGTIGANPVDADRTTAFGPLADHTSNGNTLTVAAGALTNATYAAAIPAGDPLLVSAVIDKTGQFAVFEASGAAAINGVHPPATIQAVNADPTIKRAGTAVAVGPRVHWAATGDSPLVMYPLRCGGVRALAIEDGGATTTTDPANITITPVNAGTGGSGLTLGTPVLQSGVTGYTPTNGGGAGYRKPPVLAITDQGGPGTGALGYCVIDPGGRCAGVVVTAGGSGYTNPVGTITGGDLNPGLAFSQPAVSLSQVGGVVQDDAVMTALGSGYYAPPTVTVSAPPNTGGPAGNKSAQARAIVYGADAASWGGTPGAIRAVVPMVGGLLGCGQGYTSAPSVTVGNPPAGGTAATYTAVVSNYIAAVPVVTPGADYVRPPTFTITDAGATRTAVLQPMMSGAFAATLNGTTTGGSTSVTGLASTSSLRVGHSVSGTGIPAGTTIQAIDSGTAITLSAAATASGTPSLRFADAFTYDAPASWLTATLNGFTNASTGAWTQGQPVGGLRAVTGASITNWTGQVEGATGGLLGFADTPTMLAGANAGALPVGGSLSGATNFAAKNKLHLSRPGVLRGVGVLTLSADETPVSWTNPTGPSSSGGCTIGWDLYTDGFGNQLDTMGDPAPYGVWTFCYDDPHVNTADATAVAMGSFFDSANLAITPVMLSGPESPVAIPAGNVTLSGGGLATISLTSPTDLTPQLGAGWQGAAVRIGDGTKGGSASVVVTNGVPTAINVVAGGNYSSAPSAVLYGTKVSGTTVTLQHDYEYVPTTTPGTGPTEWVPSLTVEVSQPQGTWNLGNPWLVAPDVRTRGGTAIPFDRSNPWALDDGVVAVLTTPTGRTIGALRPMDALGTYGGLTNYVNPHDLLPDGSQLNWATTRSTTVNWSFARAFNTDPASGTYAWSSTKVYGTQPWAVQGPDAAGTGCSKTITGTLTSGSARVKGVSDMGLLVGSAIAGTGVPAGATIAAVNTLFNAKGTPGSTSYTVHGDTATLGLEAGMTVACQFLDAGTTIVSVDGPNQVKLSTTPPSAGYLRCTATGTQLTLSAPATASGVQSLTVTSPGSIDLPAGNMGDFLTTSNGSGAVELRSAVPHGLSTGIVPNVVGTTKVPFAGGTSWSPLDGLLPTAHNLSTPWVTGPYTVVIGPGGLAAAGQPAGHIQRLNSTTELAVDWTLLLSQPPNPNSTSYEFEAERCKQLGCGLWPTLPQGGSDACMGEIARRILAHAGPTIPIHLEFGNELFTFANMKGYFGTLNNLVNILPDGTPVMGGTPETLASLAATVIPGLPAFQLASCAAMDAFESAWAAAGGDPSRVRRHASSQATNPNMGLAGLQVAQRTGRKIDHTHTATYVSLSAEASILQALAPAGSAFAAAGSLPADAAGAILSYQINYAQKFWQECSTRAADCGAFGQPIEPIALGTGAAGGSVLTAGTYYFYYTFEDGSGNETTVGISQAGPTAVPGAFTVKPIMPSWPPWAQALNWYVGVNAAPGVCTFYQQVTRSQYESTFPAGTPYPFTIAVPAGFTPPPAATQVPTATTGPVPTPTHYEGSIQGPVSTIIPEYAYLLHDVLLHPGAADNYRAYKVMQQRGNPTVANGGAVLACDFELTNPTQYPTMWFIAKGTSVMPGDGLGHAYATNQTYTVSPNRFATIQGGYSADGVAPDGHDHFQFGVSPMLEALRSWSDVASPSPVTPTPTPTATPTITWPTPDPIAYGTALSDAQLDATATDNGTPVAGGFAYTPAAGTIPPAGTTTLSTLFTPTDPGAYTTASASVLLTVNQATPTIDWPPPTPIAVGTGLTTAQLDATAGIPGTFVYSPPFGTVLPLGTNTLSTTFTPADSANYTTATATTTIQVITNPTPTPTATEYAFTDPDAARTVPLPAGFVIALAYTDPDAARIISPT